MLKDRQDAFFELVVGIQKQRYLKDKAEIEGVFVLFDFAEAYIFSFAPRDETHKESLFAMMILFCAAKNIRRFGYFADTWQAEEVKGLQPRHNPKRKECFIWGMNNRSGPETYYHQDHDSRNHTLVGKVITEKDGLKLGRSKFSSVLEYAAKVDWSTVGIPKEAIISNTLSYFRVEKPYDIFRDFE